MDLGFFLVTEGKLPGFYDLVLTPVYQLNNITFSELIKDEMLEMLTNYLARIYQSCISWTTLENSTNIMVLLCSFFYVGIFVIYGNYLEMLHAAVLYVYNIYIYIAGFQLFLKNIWFQVDGILSLNFYLLLPISFQCMLYSY